MWVSGCVEVGIQTPWATDGPFFKDPSARGSTLGWAMPPPERLRRPSRPTGLRLNTPHRPRKRAPHVHAPLLSEATAWEGTGMREVVDGFGSEVLLGY